MFKKPPRSAAKGRRFAERHEDYDNLRVDGPDLYWMGKKIRLTGWTIGEKIASIGLVLTFVFGALAAVANLDKIMPNLCSMHDFPFCENWRQESRM